MSDGLSDLTEKEKEALRLLLAGHDAKSSASELDISVHTINDRLRNARRKMGVSSSREAARILGDAEGATPQNPAHASFGITRGGDAEDNAILTNTKRAGPFGLTWLAGGMLIMSILIAAAVLAVVYNADDSASAPSEPAAVEALEGADGTPQAVARAKRFLAEVDAGDWQGSWDVAGPYFQSQASVEEWTQLIQPVRDQLGAAKARRIVTVQRVSTVPGAPEGDYEILQYQTQFEQREALALETVVMLQGDDGWEVVGYFVR